MQDIELAKEANADLIALRPDEIDSSAVIRRAEALVKALDGAIKVSLQRTNAADWVAMGGKYYLQATGCQKIRSVFGIYFRDKEVVKEDYPDGSYGYYVTGIIGSAVLDKLYGKEVTMECDGGRTSKDPFFSGKDGMKQPDPQDVRKAALSNFEARSIANFLGLKNFTPEDLTKNGINVGSVAKVEYKKGAEGGGNTDTISEAQRKRLFAICKSVNVAEDTIKDHLKKNYKIDSTSKILRSDYEVICNWVQAGGVEVIDAND